MIEAAAFSPSSRAGNMFSYDSIFHPQDGRSELTEVASFHAVIFNLEMPLTSYISNN